MRFQRLCFKLKLAEIEELAADWEIALSEFCCSHLLSIIHEGDQQTFHDEVGLIRDTRVDKHTNLVKALKGYMRRETLLVSRVRLSEVIVKSCLT